MKRHEKDEIRGLPSKYKPIGAWGYFGLQILFSLPLIGFICLIIFACDGSNVNRRSFARSYFCAWLIAFIFIGILIGIFFATGMFDAFKEAIQQMMEGAGA